MNRIFKFMVIFSYYFIQFLKIVAFEKKKQIKLWLILHSEGHLKVIYSLEQNTYMDGYFLPNVIR